jgi:hypothetical protein
VLEQDIDEQESSDPPVPVLEGVDDFELVVYNCSQNKRRILVPVVPIPPDQPSQQGVDLTLLSLPAEKGELVPKESNLPESPLALFISACQQRLLWVRQIWSVAIELEHGWIRDLN